MHVALIGATGNAGSRILAELVRRSHSVTAIVRDVTRVPALPGVEARFGDVSDESGLAALLRGHDAVISSVPFGGSDPGKLIAAVQRSGLRRYLVVGGAGSLEVAPGKRLMDAPGFPDAYKAEAKEGADSLDVFRSEGSGVDWTFLSPAAEIGPGSRTGHYRITGDEFLTDAHGHSRISYEDYAVALVDELERPKHKGKRFGVAY